MANPVPVHIQHRPYAVCPPTNLMNPDGFFVVNMGQQFIEAQVNNKGDTDLKNVRVYIEGISDLGVINLGALLSVGTVPARATFPVRFLANFHDAAPGIAMLSMIIEADGHDFTRILKKIFITRIDYHKPSRTYSVVMPQGTMRVNIHNAIMGPRQWICKENRGAFVVLPQDLTYDWIPTPPYTGTHGPFPYEDPWWKIALAILAALLALGALLYDYFSDGDLDGGSVSVSGTFDETDPSISCCSSVSTSASDSDDWVARGLYGAAGAAASAAIASDGPDLHYRGQEATPPKAGELTNSERVHLKIKYLTAPKLGKPFPIAGDWEYVRTTNANTYNFSASDERENIHWLDSYEVDAPAIHDRTTGPLVIRARFRKPDGSYYHSNQLYVSGFLVNTTGLARRFELKDHGMQFDERADDGWYTGGYAFTYYDTKYLTHMVRGDPPGDWYLFVFAQDVNSVEDGTKPFDAAHIIGGFVLTNQLDLNFDHPCTLLHDAVIHVV